MLLAVAFELTLTELTITLLSHLGLQESEQVGVHVFFLGRAQAMRGALVNLQGRALNELGLEQSGMGERNNLVVVTLYDERQYVELLQVLGLIRLGERQAEILEELGAVRDDTGAIFVKDRDRRSTEIGGRLNHEWWYRSDQHRLRDTLRAVVGYIARDLATACGMDGMDGILEIKFLNELCEVGGVRVHVVAVSRLARTPVAAAVMGDAAVSARSQKEHLIFKGVRGERPAVAEDHWLPGAPILVVNLRSVFSSDRA